MADPAEKDLPKLVSLLRMHSPGNPLGSEQKFWVLGTAHVSAKSSQDVRWACWPADDETHALTFKQHSNCHAKLFCEPFDWLCRRLVRAVKPQVVMIELCAARKGILTVQKLKVQPPVTRISDLSHTCSVSMYDRLHWRCRCPRLQRWWHKCGRARPPCSRSRILGLLHASVRDAVRLPAVEMLPLITMWLCRSSAAALQRLKLAC